MQPAPGRCMHRPAGARMRAPGSYVGTTCPWYRAAS